MAANFDPPAPWDLYLGAYLAPFAQLPSGADLRATNWSLERPKKGGDSESEVEFFDPEKLAGPGPPPRRTVGPGVEGTRELAPADRRSSAVWMPRRAACMCTRAARLAGPHPGRPYSRIIARRLASGAGQSFGAGAAATSTSEAGAFPLVLSDCRQRPRSSRGCHCLLRCKLGTLVVNLELRTSPEGCRKP